MHPEWSSAMVEDYLNIFENLVLLAGGVDDAVPGVPGADEDNVVVFDENGDIKDSGTGIDEVSLKVISGTVDNLLTVDSDGDMKDSGVAIDTVSLKVIGGTEDNILTVDTDGDMKDSGDSISGIETRTTRRAYFYGRSY